MALTPQNTNVIRVGRIRKLFVVVVIVTFLMVIWITKKAASIMHIQKNLTTLSCRLRRWS